MSKFGAVFLLLLLAASVNAAFRPGAVIATTAASRVAANARLTAINGALLFVVLIAVAVTVLFIRPLLTVHYLVGFALIPPLALKLYSTGYKFAAYYTGSHDFRAAGAPAWFLRFGVAPVLVASSVAVMATGLELWAFGDRFGGWWGNAHTVSAVAFMVAVFVHLLSHLRVSARAVVEDAARRPADGALTRRSVIIACAILAVVLAAASLTYATPFGPGSGGT